MFTVPSPYHSSFGVPLTISFSLFGHSVFTFIFFKLYKSYVIGSEWEDSFGYTSPLIIIDNIILY